MCAQAVFGSPILALEGETATLGTTATYLLLKPNFHEVKLYSASQWRLALSPALLHCLYYSASAGTYTEYKTQATDRVSTTHVPLDAMATTDYLYLGTSEAVLGFYFNIDGTNKNDNPATLDMEYCSGSADTASKKITGTVSAAFTVGESVLGGTSGATGILVSDDGSTYIIVRDIVGSFVIGETISGASQTCSTVTAIATPTAAAYFTDVAGTDSDGTDVAGDTLKQAGVYTWGTTPTPDSTWVRSTLGTPAIPLYGKCYWIRFKPSATLSAAVDIVDLIPVYINANYAYMEAGVEYQFSLNVAKVSGFVLKGTATQTLDLSWIRH